MVKRRKSRVRTVYKTAKRKVRKLGRKYSNPKTGNLIQPDAMIYGGLRKLASDRVLELGNKMGVPKVFGEYTDEALMGVLTWQLAKRSKGMVRNIALKGLVVENARVGEGLAQGTIFKNNNSNANTSGITVLS